MRIRNSWFVGFFFLGMAFSLSALANLAPPEREKLRYHLENLYNELDLLMRNQRVDQADLRRQKHDLEELKTFVRIPFEEDLTGLKKSLEESSRLSRVQVSQFQFMGRSANTKKVPAYLYTDNTEFHLEDNQVVEYLFFKSMPKGPKLKSNNGLSRGPTVRCA